MKDLQHNSNTKSKNAPKKILTIEFDRNMRRTLALILQSANYEVIIAENNAMALECLSIGKNETRFDMIIIDIYQPGIKVLEFIDKIKQTNLLIPILVITGYGNKQLVIELMRIGCNDYLEKPFSGDELLNRLSILLDK